VRALPLAAGTNEGGHYFRYFSSSSSFLVGTDVLNPRRGSKILHGLLTNKNKNSSKKII
jgi:hypothetical protein